MGKNINIDLTKLNDELQLYVWQGYDLFFLHGWFVAYLSAPSDSEEDILIPSYLLLDEEQIKDEKQFAQLIDKLVAIYSQLSENIFEKNKLIRPLIDLERPNNFDPLSFTPEQTLNLFNWLYGYLTGYLALGGDIIEYANNDEFLEDKFYPSLFTLCVALFKLNEECSKANISPKYAEDLQELILDLRAMWESEEDEASVDEVIAETMQELDLLDIPGALNDIFYVIRVCDENRYNTLQGQNTLLNKLSATKH